MKNKIAQKFQQDEIFTAYDSHGNLITYHDLNDVPADKRQGAISEKIHRAIGDMDFLNIFNEQRKKEAMKTP